MNKSKWIGFIIIISIFFVLYISGCDRNCTDPITYNVEVVQDEYGVWRIEDKYGYDRGSIVLNKGDRIDWQSMESDVYFAFPENVGDYFNFEDSLLSEMNEEDINRLTVPQPSIEYNDTSGINFAEIFISKQTSYIERGESLLLTVREDAPADTIEYEVFVVIGDTLVEGNSPPNLIIR